MSKLKLINSGKEELKQYHLNVLKECAVCLRCLCEDDYTAKIDYNYMVNN